MSKEYRVNEIFYSIQGEGVRTGVPHLFLRFSGCNKKCTAAVEGFDCDTEYTSSIPMDAAGILAKFRELNAACSWVLITGGEPLLQLDVELAALLRDNGFRLALETNGTINPGKDLLELLDWIACSPKQPYQDVVLAHCDELKIVLSDGAELPKTLPIRCEHKLVSPAFDGLSIDAKTIEWCTNLVKYNPDWRLSVQTHKLLGVP